MRLWIDDERVMPPGYTDWATSSAQALTLLALNDATGGELELVSFDHDLGGMRTDETSRPVLLWMIETEMWPKEIRVHTANPVGRDWLIGTAKRYARVRGQPLRGVDVR
jgi:hypothetical protein